jgi:peptidoglycan/LPS O-acetylase OafA/YrhL
MFFVRSGFVMAHVYHRAECTSEVPRIARLYPLHVFVRLLFIVTAEASQFMTGLATGSFESIPLT